MDSKKEYHCRVCGFFQGKDFPTWGPNDTCPSFDICCCCGVEFGFGDCTKDDVKLHREKWISQGCNWDLPKEKPLNWSLEKQMKNISERFR